MKISNILIFGLILVSACERENRPYGAKGSESGSSIEYSEMASVSKLPAESAGVKEVLPAGPGGGIIDGQALYVKSCSACHQANGAGLPGVFPPLANSPYVNSDNRERMAAIMLYGLAGEIPVMGTVYNGVMSAWGGSLSDEELSAIATYVRSNFGNTADPIQADLFKSVRGKFGSRGPVDIKEFGIEE